MKDEIIRFLMENANSLSYLCVPIGLLYQAYRRIVKDNREDKREDDNRKVYDQLSNNMRDMNQRIESLTERSARLLIEREMTTSDLREAKDRINELEVENTLLLKELHILREKTGAIAALKRQSDGGTP